MIPNDRLTTLRDEHAQTARDMAELQQGRPALDALDTAMALDELVSRRRVSAWTLRLWLASVLLSSLAGSAGVSLWWWLR